MPRCLAAALFAAFVFAVAGSPASAASFNCDRAYTALEKTVCADPKLSALDDQMAQNYLGLLRRVSGKTDSMLKAEQKAWLKQRNACGDDARCISTQYRARIARIADVAAGDGLIVQPQRTTTRDAQQPAPAASGIFAPRTSIFAPRPADTNDAATTASVRTTAERAAQPENTRRVSVRPDGTVDEPDQPKSPGLLKRMFSRFNANSGNGNSGGVGEGDIDTPTADRDEPQVRITRRDEKVRRNTSILPSEPQYDEPVRRDAAVARVKSPPPDETSARRKTVTTTREIDEAVAPPPPQETPVALAPPDRKLKKAARETDDPNAPAVLLYTTPDVSRVIRLPDGESPFDKLDAQRAFEEPEPTPAARVLKATPETLPQPSKRVFDARRFDAFDDTPNG